MKNIVKLAKIFDKFIELDSSFVLVDDIKAIRNVAPNLRSTLYPEKDTGIEVITPYGTFYDSTDFESFKTRIADTIEALKEKGTAVVKEVAKTTSDIIQLDNGQRVMGRALKDTPLTQIQNRVATISLAGNGSSGNLYDDTNLKVVNRGSIQILSPDGSQVANGTEGGTIQGDVISGIVYENGRYTFAAKEYPGNKITVKYQVQERR